MNTIISVIVCEDHASYREGIKNSLEYKSDIQVIAQAVDGVDLLNKLKYMTPDVILLDINMPRLNGIDTLTYIKKDPKLGKIKVIMLTMHKEDAFVSKLISIGANAYLNKEVDIETIYSTIKKCYNDEYYLDIKQQKLLMKTIQNIKLPDVQPKIKSEVVVEIPKKETKIDKYSGIIYGAIVAVIIFFVILVYQIYRSNILNNIQP